jgi:DNA replication and repair protein RecF
VLIREGEKEAAAAYSFHHETLGESDVLVRIRTSGKEVVFDGSPVRRLVDVIGRFPTVLFSSEDIQLVRGSPSLRRRFLDLYLSGSEPGYLQTLQAYHRALDSRNRLLKDNGSAAELTAFEKLMAPLAHTLVESRRSCVEVLGKLAGEFHSALSAGGETGSVDYCPDADLPGEGEYLSLFETCRPRDMQMRSTQRGPHRDDLGLQVGGRSALGFASEGQQRALVLAMRFAQLRDARARTGVAPLVLADDVLGELDPRRRQQFWSVMDPDVQLFATGTSVPETVTNTDGGGPGRLEIFEVNGGKFTKRGP